MTALISRAQDEELPFWPRFSCRLHLLYCRACRRYRRQLAWLRAGLRRVGSLLAETDPGPGPRLTAAARERIEQSLRNR